jgi:hypothetical protein
MLISTVYDITRGSNEIKKRNLNFMDMSRVGSVKNSVIFDVILIGKKCVRMSVCLSVFIWMNNLEGNLS